MPLAEFSFRAVQGGVPFMFALVPTPARAKPSAGGSGPRGWYLRCPDAPSFERWRAALTQACGEVAAPPAESRASVHAPEALL